MIEARQASKKGEQYDREFRTTQNYTQLVDAEMLSNIPIHSMGGAF
jgi:hypothetical protein